MRDGSDTICGPAESNNCAARTIMDTLGAKIESQLKRTFTRTKLTVDGTARQEDIRAVKCKRPEPYL